jgi:hypothetical protein
MPEVVTVLFEDNCSPSMEVSPVETDLGGDLCTGKMIQRTWEGPKDDCGNSAEHITQTITIIDQEGPVMPEAMPNIDLVCPKDWAMHTPVPPDATDECHSDVQVAFVADSEPSGCDDIMLTWTATDQCGLMTTVSQTVSFLAHSKVSTLRKS